MDATRRTLIAKIHIAKKDLAMDDETYRDVLQRVTGKDSCKNMSVAELKKVISDMKRLGFTPKQTAQSIQKHGRKPTTTEDRQALLSKVEAILADNDLHWHYAHAIGKQMFGVDFVHWLPADKLYKVVQALSVYQAKHNKKAKHPSGQFG